MMRALTSPVWLALALVAALVFTMVGGAPAIAYDAESHNGDLEDTGITNPATGDWDVDGNAINDCGSIEFGNTLIETHPNAGYVMVTQANSTTNRVGIGVGASEFRVINAAGTDRLSMRASAYYLRYDELIINSGNGVIGFEGSGQTNNENILFDVESTADTVAINSTTGVTKITAAGIGFTSDSYSSDAANPASAGVVRSANTEALSWRNAANDGDETLSVNASDAFVFSGPIVVPTFTRSKDMSAGSAGLGPTAPTWTVQDTLAGLEFDAAGEQAGWTVEIDDCWDGVSDMEWKLYLTTETGDVIANTEVIEFDCTYRALAEGEASDNGTAVTVSPSYTQSGAGTDSSRHKLEALLDFDGANQPLTAGDMLHMICNRDVGASDTYSGAVILEQAELEFQCTTIPNH